MSQRGKKAQGGGAQEGHSLLITFRESENRIVFMQVLEAPIQHMLVYNASLRG